MVLRLDLAFGGSWPGEHGLSKGRRGGGAECECRGVQELDVIEVLLAVG